MVDTVLDIDVKKVIKKWGGHPVITCKMDIRLY